MGLCHLYNWNSCIGKTSFWNWCSPPAHEMRATSYFWFMIITQWPFTPSYNYAYTLLFHIYIYIYIYIYIHVHCCICDFLWISWLKILLGKHVNKSSDPFQYNLFVINSLMLGSALCYGTWLSCIWTMTRHVFSTQQTLECMIFNMTFIAIFQSYFLQLANIFTQGNSYKNGFWQFCHVVQGLLCLHGLWLYWELLYVCGLLLANVGT